jgi:cell division protease FtsH
MVGMIIYLLWRTLQVMPRVKTKSVNPTSKSSVSWDEVAGLEEARDEMEEIVDFLARLEALREARRARAEGDPAPRAAGTGKTLLAKAVARESGASFYSQSASAFVEMFAGLGAARIRKLFEQARKDAPAIVFIDELDAVGAARSRHGFNREQDQTLNQLLVELDGFNNRDQVIVMARRTGSRISTRLFFVPGASTGRSSFRRPTSQVVRRSSRCTRVGSRSPRRRPHRGRAPDRGPDRRRPRQHRERGAIFAGRENQQHIHHVHFENAMERVIAGLSSARDDREGEADPRLPRGRPRAHVAPDGPELPVRRRRSSRADRRSATRSTSRRRTAILHTREEFIDWMKIALAGRAAEQVVFGRVTNGAANDLEKVTELARSMVFEYGMSEGSSRGRCAPTTTRSPRRRSACATRSRRACTDDAYAEAVRLITKHRTALDRLAQACSRRRRSSATRCSRSSPTSSPSRARARPSAGSFHCHASKKRPTEPPPAADSILVA